MDRQKKYESNKRHDDKTYDRLSIAPRKDRRTKERLAAAAEAKGTKPATYILDALEAALTRDGYGLDTIE